MNDLQRRQVEETQNREIKSKAEWAKQHAEEAGRITIYRLDDEKNLRLHQLKEQVADLCDLQPTPASMVRPPRKVPSPRLARRARLCAPQLTARPRGRLGRRCYQASERS